MTPFSRWISSEYDRYEAKTQFLNYPYRRLSAASALQPLGLFAQYCYV